MTDAFDSDVLIYAANGASLGREPAALIAAEHDVIGSAILLPEVLSKPLRQADSREYRALLALLARIDLKDVDYEIADAAASLGAKYGLRAADAIHLATAVVWGAERFHTNNRKDFGPRIEEVEVVWPTAE